MEMIQPQKNHINIFKLTIRFFYGISLFWVLFGVFWLFRDSDYRFFYFVMALGNAILLVGLGYYLSKKKTWAFYISLSILGINILLTITDQVGWFDFAYLIPAIVLFYLTLKIKPYLKKE